MTETIEILGGVRETVPALDWRATPGQIKLNTSRRRLLDELIAAEEGGELIEAIAELEISIDIQEGLEVVIEEVDEALDTLDDHLDNIDIDDADMEVLSEDVADLRKTISKD
jgi:hypothetical protein